MTKLLVRSSLRYLAGHRWLLVLSIVGVALGVAVVVAIDLANTSARTAFSLSSESVAGKATHRIVGGADGLPDAVYVDLRTRLGFENSAPVVEGFAATPLESGRTLHVLGVDPLAEAPFRAYVGGDGELDLSEFLTGRTTALVSDVTAEELGLAQGDPLPLSIEGVDRAVEVIGIIRPDNERSRRALANLVITDVSTAKSLFSFDGRLSYVDLILDDDEVEALGAQLPEGVQIVRSSSRTETLAQMSRAFELNLTALSLLALVVGMFLTYNTMNFSVVQRRPLIGRMRAIGVSRREVLSIVLVEALLVGAVGTIVGILLGVVLGNGLVHLVTRTINDLYYVVSVREASLTFGTAAKGVLLGLGATVLSAWMPARAAARAPASTVLQRSAEEGALRNRVPLISLGGVVCAAGGALLLWLPGKGIGIAYGGVFLVLMGFALVAPGATLVLSRVMRPALNRGFGVVGRMAAGGIASTLSRTSVAIAALMIAVAATIGVGVMVTSFRTTVVSWLDNALQADVYIQPPNLVFRSGAAEIRPDLVNEMRAAPGVAESYTVRHVSVNTSTGPSQLSAIESGRNRESTFVMREGNAAQVFHDFQLPGRVMISEPYAYRHGLARGDTLRILTDRGEVGFEVAGVFYDYASDQGVVLIHRSNYEAVFDDRGYSGLALYTEDGMSRDVLISRLRGIVGDRQQLLIRSNRDLRDYSLEIFDRTFTITLVLRILAVVVAFVGVVSALLSLQLERAGEYTVLKAVGMTRGQRRRMIVLETGLMGTFAGLLAVPLGLVLAWVLIFVINRRSFGWTLQFTADLSILAQAMVVSIVAALLAGLAAIRRVAT